MLAQPSWQMIYMAVLSLVAFASMSHWAEYLNLLPPHYLQAGINYQRIIMYSGPLAVINKFYHYFFIGQGRSMLVAAATLIVALSNILLDYLLIYRVYNLLPFYGEKGAAVATILAQLIQITILASVFLSNRNRRNFNTAKPRWIPSLFKNIIKVGLPVAFNETLALMSWLLILTMINHTSKELTTVYTLEINIYLLMIFLGDGLCKASAAINSNLIGQNNLPAIRVTVKRLMIMATGITAVMSLVLIIFGNRWWTNLSSELLSIVANNKQDIINSLYLLILGVLTETLLAILWGVLLAGGDTYFAAISYQICLWVGSVLPLSFIYFTKRLCHAEQPFFFSLCWSTGILSAFGCVIAA